MLPFLTPMRPDDVRRMGLLELAYVGDTVCDLYVRERLARSGRRVRELHGLAVSQVNAQAQADALERIRPLLTEEELALVRRGRNAKAHHSAPHGVQASVYHQSTAFEALLGALYLTGSGERLLELLQAAMETPE